MRPEFIFLLLVAGFSIVLAIIPIDNRGERQAKRELCTKLAGQFFQAEVSLADYLATRCPARLISDVKQNE